MSQAVKIVNLAPIGALVTAGCAGLDGTGLPAALRRAVAAQEPRIVAVAYRDLRTGDEVLVKGDVVMHAASTMKVPVMIELLRQAEAGKLALADTIPLRNRFKSIVDGSWYALTPEDDSDKELYRRVGQAVGLRELLRRMIDTSSNLATNVLIDLVGARNIQRRIESLGTTHMRVLRGVEDNKAYRAGLSNTATARDLMVILAAIAEDRAASADACAEMRAILLGQTFNDMIPAGLPPGTRVAHKTGSISGIHHDAAIVYPPAGSPYVLVVLTKGFDDKKESARVVAEIAALVDRGRR